MSFHTAYDPPSWLLYTVLANTSGEAWPIAEALDGMFPELVQE